MRTSTKTIVRREHWRWQRCGPGRSELRRVRVRQSSVLLGPTDTRQIDLLDQDSMRVFERGSRHRPATHRPVHVEERPVLRSYWRRQPYGPGSGLRKTILVDVRG